MMGEMQNVDMRTTIEIALDIDSDNMTTASKLYEFLGLSPSNYSNGAKQTLQKMSLLQKTRTLLGSL